MKVLITGGASGLGEAITRELSKEIKDEIYFTYNFSKINAQKLEQEFSNTKSLKCDFSIENEVSSLLDQIIQIEPDVLINNAWTGIKLQHFHKQNILDFEENYKLNIIPTLRITQQSIKIFRKKKYGKIITILTAALYNKHIPGYSDYCAAKAYLESMSKSWASENAQFNITSNTISPSTMLTKIHNIDERFLDDLKEKHPLKKLLSIQETADVVRYFVRCSSHINGVNLSINAASYGI